MPVSPVPPPALDPDLLKRAGEADLLKRAVVALERRLRQGEAAAAAAARAAAAAHDEVEQHCQRLQRDAAAAREEAEEARRQRDRAHASLAEAAEMQAAQAAAVTQHRACGEAAQAEAARAQGQAEVLSKQVEQLEAANAELREVNQQHTMRLKDAYEREGQLLAELGELRTLLRTQQGGGSGTKGGLPLLALCASPDQSCASGSSLEAAAAAQQPQPQPRHDLLAAAQQLTQQYDAKVEQARGQ